MQQQLSKLTQAKIQNILKLQQLFYNKFLTVQLLHQLISLYTCCIESIDQSQEQLRNYFLEKIQFVLSRPQMQAMLHAVNSNGGADKAIVEDLRETLRDTKRELPGDGNGRGRDREVKPNFNRKRLHNYDGDNPEDKKKKIDIQLKLMSQMEDNMKIIKDQVNQADLKLKNQKLKIKDITKEQNNKLQQRLARRKLKKRKNSADQVQQLSPPKVNKADLLKAQTQINDAVIRITVRATQRQHQMNVNQNVGNQVKGRIKMLKRVDTDD